MMCEKCGLNPAAVTLTQVINGKKTVTRLCAACAQENNIYKDLNMDLGFSSLFSSFFNEHEKAQADNTCPVCGMHLGEFLKLGKPGCSECYSAFESTMAPLLKKIHSTTTHTGKVMGISDKPCESKIDILKAELRKAIENEEYEKAARLRDEIKEMEGRL